MLISLQELATKRRWTNLDSIPVFSWGGGDKITKDIRWGIRCHG